MECRSLHSRVLNVIRNQRFGDVKIAIENHIFHAILLLAVQRFKQFIAFAGVGYAFDC